MRIATLGDHLLEQPVIRMVRYLAPALTLLGFHCTGFCAEFSDAGKTFVYVARVHATEAYARAQLERIYADDAESLEISQSILTIFSLEDLAIRCDDAIRAAIPAEEAAVCARFASTKAGAILVSALENEADPTVRKQKLGAIPVTYHPEIVTFLAAPCRAKALDLINSDRFAEALGEYGESIVCEQIIEVSPKEFKRLKKLGKCLGPVRLLEP